MTNRRQWILGAAAAARWAKAAPRSSVRIGVTDWNLRKAAQLEAVALAKSLGFAGVEISLGRQLVGGALPLAAKDVQDRYLSEARQQGIALAGTCLDILHVNYLKNDSLAQRWVADGIGITRTLQAGCMLLPFFGKGALTTRQEMDTVADLLRELAPAAEKAGVVLGLENTCSAADNVRMIERTRSSAVKVYYDVGNSANNGHDIYKEIPWLGADRICQFHFKDGKGYLGEGQIRFSEVINLINGLGFQGFANLETSAPSGDVEADMRRNLAYIHGVIQKA